MSYFDSQLGRRPATQPQPPRDAEQEPRLFEASLGACPREPAGGQTLQAGQGGADRSLQPDPVGLCPLCRGALAEQAGIFRCQGRCGARWLPDTSGALLDIAALPYGICACCRPPQALAHAEGGAVCPQSGQAHLLLPGGPALRAQAAPEGLCLCCVPPAPLVHQGTELVCLARPGQRYELHGGVPSLLVAPTDPSATLAAIDTALRHNSARVAVNGLFDVES